MVDEVEQSMFHGRHARSKSRKRKEVHVLDILIFILLLSISEKSLLQ